MTISVTNIGTNSGKGVTTLAVTVPVGGVPAGALIIVGVTTISAVSTPSLVDSKSNSYSIAVGGPGTGTLTIYFVWSGTNALVSGDTITFTASSFTGAISALYATGTQTSSTPLDKTGISAISTTTTPSANTGTAPTVAGELIVGFIGSNGPSGDAFTQDTTDQGGFSTPPIRAGTTAGGATSNQTIAGGSQVWNANSGTAFYAPTITSRQVQAAIATFKPLVLPIDQMPHAAWWEPQPRKIVAVSYG
jgi:hypothetical protein